jgi:mannose-6-phosphate isomerase
LLGLECVVQPYAWGDTEAIPALLGVEPSGQPAAELWMGAHPAGPSLVHGEPLNELIAANPLDYLGPDITAAFGGLPFLAKILAAARPLSIQSHPTLSQARAGFARENEAGIALGSPQRVYGDPNHKPELVCALSAFDAKCGFRDLDRTRELFSEIGGSELAELRARLDSSAPAQEVLSSVLAWLLELEASSVAILVAEVLTRSQARRWEGAWFAPELGWIPEMISHYPSDIGTVVALLLNHVTLLPGQALFLGAGNLHTYLRGVAVEIMANSNNVVRGGLTPKHIDVPELLSVVNATPIDVPIQVAGAGSHTFDVPVADFGLTRVTLGEREAVIPVGPEIVFVTEGSAMLTGASSQQVVLSKGQAVFVPASEVEYWVGGHGVLWRATTGHAGSVATG